MIRNKEYKQQIKLYIKHDLKAKQTVVKYSTHRYERVSIRIT
jgi:hypothetical protein